MKSKSPLFANHSVKAGAGPDTITSGKSSQSIDLQAGLVTDATDKKTKGKITKNGNAKSSNGLSRKKSSKRSIFTKKGHVTPRSIAARREFFLGKSVARIEHELKNHGYKVTRRGSKHPKSKAKIILTLNASKQRNIEQIQISPGTSRHGNVPYVKISTNDYGKIKIVGADRESYKTDGHEKAIIFFRRVKKND